MRSSWLVAALLLVFSSVSCQSTKSKKVSNSSPNEIQWANKLFENHRQLTVSGQRSGESYFSPDGKQMVFQSEREADNPFYQIYLMNLESGKTQRVSPGYGKTTCAWVHPSQEKIMYSSTHLDPKAREKMQAEIDFRNSGKQRRYSWDYDPHYDIFSASPTGKNTIRLTKAFGYDAEGSYSPDGEWIAFSSNRHAYTQDLSPEDQERFKNDPSFMLDIYIMKADGSQVKRLTTHKGYDGGPFFSPDGKRIIWRRFAADGHTAEIYTMKIDGSDVQRLTNLGAMSWAPFYHPSGDYVIFTTNKHGYHNFELYLVDTKGLREPVRVTDMSGFDGLPVFLPGGDRLAWSRKMSNGQSQIFISDWNDRLARKALALPAAKPTLHSTNREISKDDVKAWIEYLADRQFEGRMTGSEHEKKYAATLARFFKDLGLKPAVGNSMLHTFDFLSKVELTGDNQLHLNDKPLTLSRQWTPLSSSKSGSFSGREIVFAGYGIVAPSSDKMKAYDSYANLDVKDKWVMILRYLPEEVEANRRLYLNRYARLEHKVMMARNRGAKGVVFFSGPTSGVKEDLIPLQTLAGALDSSLPILSIDDQVAQEILASSKTKLDSWLKKADKEELIDGFSVKASLAGHVDLKPIYKKGINVIAKLEGTTTKSPLTLILGAHGDHLGRGQTGGSLKNSTDKDDIHYGADDNASGVAGVMELAQHFAQQKNLRSDVIFAVWSGEELGNLGSSAFTKKHLNSKNTIAYLNFDMIGRLNDKLSIQGTASSKEWQNLLEPLIVTSKVRIATQEDPYLPTDAIAFYNAKVPVLSFFTGTHKDYHSPRDTPEKINYDGLINTLGTAKKLVDGLAARSKVLPYEAVQATGKENKGRRFRIFLGTMPDYTNKKVKGVKLSGVIKGGPAEKAGLQGGDIIVEFATMKIENIYDYVYTLETLKPGKKTQITVLRSGQKRTLDITPASKN